MYGKLRDEPNRLKYTELETEYENKYRDDERKEYSKAITFLMGKEFESQQIAKSRLHGMIIIAVLVTAALSLLVCYFFCGKRKAGEKLKITELLNQSQINTLKKKVAYSYLEVIEMAKRNDALFVTVYKELYPDFYKKLLAVQPSLTLVELKVCFYISLKFTTKEIADYTYVSIKTIQNRKNKLRKRLFIDERADIYIWIENLAKATELRSYDLKA